MPQNPKTNDKLEHCIYKINDKVSDFFSYQKKSLQVTVKRMASPGGEWPKASEKNEHGLTHN